MPHNSKSNVKPNIRPYAKTYSSELERSFTLPSSLFFSYFNSHCSNPVNSSKTPKPLSNPPYFHLLKEEHIEQLWTSAFIPLDGTTSVKNRVRKTETLNFSNTPTITYEVTTKYEKRTDSCDYEARIEINTPIPREEYELILSLFSKTPTRKTRLYFYDLGDDILGINQDYHPLYSVDSYPPNDPYHDYAVLEIEFNNKAEANAYKPPEWLTELQKKAKEMGQNR